MADLIDRLNGLLRGEISAVETYNQVMDRAECAKLKSTLSLCQIDHMKRVQLLRNRIVELGGTPSEDSGIWGALAKLLEGGAAVFGERAAVDMLEQGEDHGLETYNNEVPKLDEDNLRLVQTQLLPAQEQTHRTIRDLKHSMQAA